MTTIKNYTGDKNSDVEICVRDDNGNLIAVSPKKPIDITIIRTIDDEGDYYKKVY